MAGMRQTRPEPASSQPAPAPDGRLASAPPRLGELLALASELARDAARVHIEGRRGRPEHRDEVLPHGPREPESTGRRNA